MTSSRYDADTDLTSIRSPMLAVNSAKETLSGVSHGAVGALINSAPSNRGLTFGVASSLITEEEQ